jgi:hypothetical protein
VADLKLLLQLEGSAYDDQLQAYLWAATNQIEQYCNISLSAKTVICSFEQRSADGVWLPFSPLDTILTAKWKRCPLQLIDATYTILNEGEQDATFIGENNSGSMPWPTYRVEYTTTALQSYDLKEAVKQQAAYLYTHRDELRPEKWSPFAKALADANKRGNF